jgi:hypothetical protein
MGDIFRNAYGVLVWLGADEDADKISDAVARVSSKAFRGVCSVVSTWAAGHMVAEGAQYRIQGSAEDFWGDGPLSAESMIWVNVLELYRRGWFLRLWVVQEISLARRATVIWGRCEISWQLIGLAAAIIRTNWNRIVPDNSSSDNPRRLVPVGVMNAYFMYRISRFQDHFDPLRFSFCELLTLTRQFQCEDKRDKIFGLLGLTTTDGVNLSITPDYTKPLAEVYRNVASTMTHSKSLAFLSHVHHRDICDGHFSLQDEFSCDARKTGPALPSWIPTWDVIGPQTLTPLDAHPDFAAGTPKPARFLAGDPNRLVVRGVVLEDVKDTNRIGAMVGLFEPQLTLETKGDGLEQRLARHGHTRRSLEKLAMTLAAGKSWYGTPVADRACMLADFADCLVTGKFWWVLEPDAFGSWPGSEGQRILGDHASLPPAEGAITMHELKAISKGGNGNLFLDAVATACAGRRLFCTASGMRGVGPFDIQPGDKLCVIYGTPMPFIIRRRERQGYEHVGECYIDDIMHGEAVDDETYEETWIDLV